MFRTPTEQLVIEGECATLHVMTEEGGAVEVWLNPDMTPDTGLCLGVGDSRQEALSQAVTLLERALETLQTTPAPV